MKRTALLAAAGLLLLRAFGRYQIWFTRPWRGDPGNHNYAVLAGESLREAVRTQMQPLLEYWLRAKVWLPVLGLNERGFRLPGAFYGLALVAIAMLLAHRKFREKPFAAAAVSLAVGAWLSGSDWVAWEATGGRHYALVALFSVLWFSVAFLDLGFPRWALPAVSLAFVNTHFFALPLVGAYYLLRRDWKPALAIVAVTAALNWPALSHLLLRFPAETQAPRPLSQGSAFAIIAEGWKQFWVPALWVALAGATALLWKPRRRNGYWLFPLLIVPAEIALIHFCSAYPFKERYHAVFLGQVFVLMLVGCEGILEMSGRWKAAAALALLLFFAVPGALYEGARVRPRVPAANFTDTWAAYTKIAALGAESLIIHEQAKGDVRLARFYLTAQGLELPRLFGTPSVSEGEKFEAALARESKASLVLDGLGRETCREVAPARLLHKGERCVLVLSGGTDLGEVERVARLAGISFFSGLGVITRVDF